MIVCFYDLTAGLMKGFLQQYPNLRFKSGRDVSRESKFPGNPEKQGSKNRFCTDVCGQRIGYAMCEEDPVFRERAKYHVARFL